MANLSSEIQYILEKGIELKKKYTDDYKFELDYLNVFSNNPEEFDQYVEQGIEIGKLFRERDKGVIIKLNDKIIFNNTDVGYIQIAKPHRGKGMRGYLSYTLNNFKELKDEFSRSQNILSVQKKGYLRLEVIDKTYDIMVYLASDSLIANILNPNKNINSQEEENQPEILENLEETIDETSVRESNSSFEIERQLIEEKGKRMQLIADFQNYQKRVEAEKVIWGASANMSLIQDILEVHDDIEFALQDTNLNLETAKHSLKGAQDKVLNAVQRTGVEKIEIKIGDNFDKEKMEAISMMPVQDETQKNKVIVIISSAYKYKSKDSVLKAAKVIIGK